MIRLKTFLLKLEPLESRDLLATLRVADWNTFNLPNSPTDDANYATILSAIGSESILGTAKRIDLLAIQESDPPSAVRLANVFNGLYGASTYSQFVSSIDGGGDSTGFVFDTTTLSLLEAIEVPGALTHNVTRGKFRPAGTSGATDFYTYSVHLKSGNTGSDAMTRAAEMAILRQDADLLGEGTSVIFAGDFNMQSSSEGAWTSIVSAGAGQASDLADTPGSWTNNPVFKTVHSHSTSAMNGRFDFQFVTGELRDNAGLDYVAGSIHVFGNNGSHGFSGGIDTGTGASPTVLAALRAASDHLPVVADYAFVPNVPVIVSQTSGTTEVREGGPPDTYSIVLGGVPTADVNIAVTPSPELDIGAGTGATRFLSFTPATAFVPQFISVSAVDDSRYEGTEQALISHRVASTDAFFNAYSVADLAVTILDDDLPKLVINELDSDTPNTDNREFIEIYDGGVGNFPLDGLSLILFSGGGGRFDLDGYSTDANGFFVAGNPLVPGVDLEFSPGTLQNGPDAAALYVGDPSQIVGITTVGLLDAIVYGTNDPDDPLLLTLLLPGEPQANESAGGSSSTQSLSRMPDGGIQRATSSYQTRPPTPGVRNAAPTADFDTDGDIDCDDVNALVFKLSGGQWNTTFDLNSDGLLNNGDLGLWLALAGNANLPSHLPYRFGDANLDGVVDGSDFGIWNSHKFTSTPEWCSGDFTADGVIDGSDFNVWNANKFTGFAKPSNQPSSLAAFFHVDGHERTISTVLRVIDDAIAANNASRSRHDTDPQDEQPNLPGWPADSASFSNLSEPNHRRRRSATAVHATQRSLEKLELESE